MTDHRTLSKQQKSLKAMTVNINGLSKHSFEIVHQSMLKNRVQISCVTETKKQNTEIPDLLGFFSIPKTFPSNPSQLGGDFLVFDVNIKPSVFNLEIEIQHSTCAICKVSRKSILVGGAHCRPNSIEETKRNEIRLAKKGKELGVSSFLLLDNFISRHPSWGDISNAQGEILNDFLQQEKFVALNDGEPTFTCTKGKRIIDLVLCNANLRRLFCGHAIDYYTGMYISASNRGHYPVIATFDIAGNSRSTHVKNLKKTDWGKREGNPRKLRSITMA